MKQAPSQLALPPTARQPVRVDEYTGQRFTFFADPDGLPLELYEQVERLDSRP